MLYALKRFLTNAIAPPKTLNKPTVAGSGIALHDLESTDTRFFIFHQHQGNSKLICDKIIKDNIVSYSNANQMLC